MTPQKKLQNQLKMLQVFQYCENSPEPVPPVEIIKKIFKKRHIPWHTFTNELDLSKKEKEAFWNGEITITKDIAKELEDFLEAPEASFWTELETIYQRKRKAQ